MNFSVRAEFHGKIECPYSHTTTIYWFYFVTAFARLIGQLLKKSNPKLSIFSCRGFVVLLTKCSNSDSDYLPSCSIDSLSRQRMLEGGGKYSMTSLMYQIWGGQERSQYRKRNFLCSGVSLSLRLPLSHQKKTRTCADALLMWYTFIWLLMCLLVRQVRQPPAGSTHFEM